MAQAVIQRLGGESPAPARPPDVDKSVSNNPNPKDDTKLGRFITHWRFVVYDYVCATALSSAIGNDYGWQIGFASWLVLILLPIGLFALMERNGIKQDTCWSVLTLLGFSMFGTATFIAGRDFPHSVTPPAHLKLFLVQYEPNRMVNMELRNRELTLSYMPRLENLSDQSSIRNIRCNCALVLPQPISDQSLPDVPCFDAISLGPLDHTEQRVNLNGTMKASTENLLAFKNGFESGDPKWAVMPTITARYETEGLCFETSFTFELIGGAVNEMHEKSREPGRQIPCDYQEGPAPTCSTQ